MQCFPFKDSNSESQPDDDGGNDGDGGDTGDTLNGDEPTPTTLNASAEVSEGKSKRRKKSE